MRKQILIACLVAAVLPGAAPAAPNRLPIRFGSRGPRSSTPRPPAPSSPRRRAGRGGGVVRRCCQGVAVGMVPAARGGPAVWRGDSQRAGGLAGAGGWLLGLVQLLLFSGLAGAARRSPASPCGCWVWAHRSSWGRASRWRTMSPCTVPSSICQHRKSDPMWILASSAARQWQRDATDVLRAQTRTCRALLSSYQEPSAYRPKGPVLHRALRAWCRQAAAAPFVATA